MSDGGDLGVQCLAKAKTCCCKTSWSFGFGAPAWNDSRCSEKAGERVHAARVPWVFAFWVVWSRITYTSDVLFFKRYQP